MCCLLSELVHKLRSALSLTYNASLLTILNKADLPPHGLRNFKKCLKLRKKCVFFFILTTQTLINYTLSVPTADNADHSLIRGVLIQSCPPELKISPIMYFVMYNSSVVLSKILKIIVTLEQNFEKTDFYSIKLVILIIIDIGK